MLNVIVTDPPRADLAEVDKLAGYGVATVHEAIGRNGYLGPAIRPNQQGTRIAGIALTVVCWPGDNLMIHAAVEQAKPGDIIVITTTSPSTDGAFGELLATSLAARGVRGLVMGAGLRDTRELRDMGFPAWTANVSAQGTVKETPGSVNVPVTLGGQVIKPGDAIVADDDGVCVVPRLDVGKAVTASAARVAKEDANRKQLADGVLGLDMYNLRPKLARVDYITYAEYTRRAGEGILDMAEHGVRCMLMRGGTSKGAYFLAGDLPAGTGERDDLLLRIMGSPDPRQIDGLGGAHPLTSKVAVVCPSQLPGVDVDYLFLQVVVDQPVVTDKQNCGNILAGIGPFAVERGLITADRDETKVRIRMVNTDQIVTATFPTPDGTPRYDGDTAIDGVPGTAAPVVLDFENPGTGASVLPTGSITDVFHDIQVTCVDNGMPVVVVAASSLGKTGYESIAELEGDEELNRRVQELRLEAGKAMGLGDVSATTVPKISLVAPPRTDGGTISTRTFIPVRVHESIGVLGAVSVATAVMLPGAAGSDLAVTTPGNHRLSIEHPSGALQVEVELDTTTTPPKVMRSGVVRTARKLFDGTAFPRLGSPGSHPATVRDKRLERRCHDRPCTT